MYRKSLVLILMLFIVIFGFSTFVYVQKANCEEAIKSQITLHDIDFSQDENNQREENLFKSIIFNSPNEKQMRQNKLEYEKKTRMELLVNSIIFILTILIIIRFRKKLVVFINIARKIMKAPKIVVTTLVKKRGIIGSIIGKIIISIIAIYAFHRCVINPPIYYNDGGRKINYSNSKYQIPTTNINKLISELLGLGILCGLAYFLLVKNNRAK